MKKHHDHESEKNESKNDNAQLISDEDVKELASGFFNYINDIEYQKKKLERCVQFVFELETSKSVKGLLENPKTKISAKEKVIDVIENKYAKVISKAWDKSQKCFFQNLSATMNPDNKNYRVTKCFIDKKLVQDDNDLVCRENADEIRYDCFKKYVLPIYDKRNKLCMDILKTNQ